MKKLLYICLCLMALVTGITPFAKAQDPHFTQYHRIPNWYNAARTGENVEHIRLTMLYRNQWASLGSPYKTQALFFDKQVHKIGLGFNLINNGSGDAGIRQLYLNGQLAYRLQWKQHSIAAGLQVGLIQKSFDPSKMTFDDQYTPDQGYNPGNPTAESFSYTKLTRPDIGGGVHWSLGSQSDIKIHPFAGISFQHVNQAKESFIETDNQISRKLTMQGGFGYVLSEQLTIIPQMSYSKQLTSHELLYGMQFVMPLENRDRVEFALNMRQGDAACIYAGYQHNSWMLGVSYDVNTSALSAKSGSYELSLTWVPKAKEKKEPVVAKKKDPTEKKGPESTMKQGNAPIIDDLDGDGVLDRLDRCPEEAGTRLNKGCPEKEKVAAEPASKVVGKPIIGTPKPGPAKPQQNTVAPQTAPQATVEKIPVKKAQLELVKLTPEIQTRKTATIQSAPIALKDEVPAVESAMKMLRPRIPVKTPRAELKTVKPKVITTTPITLRDEENAMMTKAPLLSAQVKVKVLPAAKVRTRPVKEVKTPTEKPEVVETADADKDGIVDSKDACPYIKGSKLTSGCPDTDNDGIADSDDPCPYQAGTKASNGCPVKSALEKELEQPSVAVGNIEFKTGSDQVKGIYKLDIIEPVLDSLYQNESLVLILTGHTDGEGDAGVNMVLSQARADAVKEIFKKKGLDESRIRTVAYGETMPLKDNRVEEGRARNRRVEIRIMNAVKK